MVVLQLRPLGPDHPTVDTIVTPEQDDPLAEEACANLRLGMKRGKQLAAEAKERLSELTSDSVYPGIAGIILTDANNVSFEPGSNDNGSPETIPPSLS